MIHNIHHNLTLVNSERATVSQAFFIPQKSLTAQAITYLKTFYRTFYLYLENDGDYIFFP